MKDKLPCEAHKFHRPRNLTVEWHHVIPRAWQHAWMPKDAVLLHDHGYEPLWDITGTSLCPSGHRNVHAIIVKLMKQVPVEIGSRNELKIASRALEMFTAAGGDIQLLRAKKLWGDA